MTSFGEPILLFPNPAHPGVTRLFRDPPAMTVSVPPVLVPRGDPRPLARILTNNVYDRVSVWISSASGVPAGLIVTTQIRVSAFDSSDLQQAVATVAKPLGAAAATDPWVLQVSGVRGVTVELWAGADIASHLVSWAVLLDRSHCCVKTVIS
jgi:hypothetical protein